MQTQKHPEYSGPTLGPKMAEENRRNFSEEEIRRMRDAEVGGNVRIESIDAAVSLSKSN